MLYTLLSKVDKKEMQDNQTATVTNSSVFTLLIRFHSIFSAKIVHFADQSFVYIRSAMLCIKINHVYIDSIMYKFHVLITWWLIIWLYAL